MQKSLLVAITATGLVLSGLTGCGKKDTAETDATAAPADAAATDGSTATAAPSAPAAPAGKETLPGANAVRAAIAAKDYDTAVGGVMALRGAATTDANAEYVALYGEVIDALREQSSTDRKAAEALMKLQALSRGR